MRIRLNKKFQRKFFYLLKDENRWSRIATELGTSVCALKGYAIYGNTIPKTLYEKIKTKESDKHIIEVLKDHWGMSKGGKNSRGSTKRIKKPKFSEQLAEAVGIILGDGSIYTNNERGVYQVRIASNIHNETEYSINFIKPLFETLFGVSARSVRSPDHGVIYVAIDSKELTDFFTKVGLQTGEKKSKSGIPGWIKKEDAFLMSCIRGLIDTDGSVHRLSNKDPNLKRITFKNANERLLKDVRSGLLALGFHPSKVTHRNLFLTRKDDIRTFVDKIGFNNTKHIERFAKLSPVV